MRKDRLDGPDAAAIPSSDIGMPESGSGSFERWVEDDGACGSLGALKLEVAARAASATPLFFAGRTRVRPLHLTACRADRLVPIDDDEVLPAEHSGLRRPVGGGVQ